MRLDIGLSFLCQICFDFIDGTFPASSLSEICRSHTHHQSQLILKSYVLCVVCILYLEVIFILIFSILPSNSILWANLISWDGFSIRITNDEHVTDNIALNMIIHIKLNMGRALNHNFILSVREMVGGSLDWESWWFWFTVG